MHNAIEFLTHETTCGSPRHHAAIGIGGKCGHVTMPSAFTLPATRMAAGPTRRTEPPAGNGNGGRGLSFLTKNFAGGFF
jgi:hypothetical protein